ncbi:hypothetical protein Peetri_00078 [Pseudomonas phage vB_PpuM-Peetri]
MNKIDDDMRLAHELAEVVASVPASCERVVVVVPDYYESLGKSSILMDSVDRLRNAGIVVDVMSPDDIRNLEGLEAHPLDRIHFPMDFSAIEERAARSMFFDSFSDFSGTDTGSDRDQFKRTPTARITPHPLKALDYIQKGSGRLSKGMKLMLKKQRGW